MLSHDDLKKGAWTPEEDLLLKCLVDQLGPARWSIVAERIPGRSGKSCRLRWHNHLSPAVKKAPFSEYEDAVILKAHDIHGNKWSVIAKLLPGRTDNAVKNRWNSTLKRKAGTQGLRNRFLAKGITLDLLLTQYAHHAHDNAPQPTANGRAAATASPCSSDDSGSDLEDVAPSVAPGAMEEATTAATDASMGPGASDDEGTSPVAHHSGAQAFGQQRVPAFGAAAYGLAGYGYSPYYGFAPPPQSVPQHMQKQQQCDQGYGAYGAARCGSMFSEDDDCCDTVEFGLCAGGAGALGGIASPVETEDSEVSETVQSLLDGFAAAGAAAAAAAAAMASAADVDDAICGAASAVAGAWHGFPGCDAVAVVLGAPAGSKRDLASSLCDATADDTASPMKRLRLGMGPACDDVFGPASAAPAFGHKEESAAAFQQRDEFENDLPICYADQRVGSCSDAPGAESAVRQQHSKLQPDQQQHAKQERRQPDTGAADRDWGIPAATGLPASDEALDFGIGFDLLDSLPPSIRCCLVDAAALYLANDASCLAA